MGKVYYTVGRLDRQTPSEGWLMGMRSTGLIGATAAFAIAAAFMIAAIPASAADRPDGAYWKYDVIMELEGFDVDGEATYTSEGDDTIVVGGEEYDVTAMRLSGEMSGTMSALGMTMTFEVAISGYSYELAGSLATVKDDMNMFINATTEALGIEVTVHMQNQILTTYDPALLVGFDDESGPGDSWEEVTNTTMVSTTWEEGVKLDETTDESEMTYTIQVASTLDDVEVDGTTYPCMKITITDQDGNYEMRWYNEAVGDYPQVKEYEYGASAPLATMKLTEFSTNGSGASSLMLIAGIGIAVAVVAVIAILLLMRRRKPAPMPPMQPVQPGYYAPPPQGPPPPPPGQ